MEYRLEVYPRGNCDQDDCITMFTSTAPFPPFHIDDLLDASAWKAEGPKRLRIVSVEHAIVEKPALGIDPSGGIINRTLIHTEAA